MLFHNTPTGNLGDLFKSTFQSAYSILSKNIKLLSLKNNLGHELYAFLFTQTLFYMSQKKKKIREQALNDLYTVCDSFFAYLNNSYFQKRFDFYKSRCFDGFIRNDWFLSKYPNQPDIRLFIVFGDCLYNSDCVTDYDDAPISTRSVFEQMEYNKMMLKIQEILQEYCKSVGKL